MSSKISQFFPVNKLYLIFLTHKHLCQALQIGYNVSLTRHKLFFLNFTTGTGASGEILSTHP